MYTKKKNLKETDQNRPVVVGMLLFFHVIAIAVALLINSILVEWSEYEECAYNAIFYTEKFLFSAHLWLLMNLDDIDPFSVCSLRCYDFLAFNSIGSDDKNELAKISMYFMGKRFSVCVCVRADACLCLYLYDSYVRRPRVETHLSTNVKNFNTKIPKWYLKSFAPFRTFTLDLWKSWMCTYNQKHFRFFTD